MTDLSILIPARNEMFLKRTIDDILAHKKGNTEIIAVLDGDWPMESIPDHPDVHMIIHFQSVGQRAATNEAARLSNAKYLMKCDAHCSFDDGFDIKMMQEMQDNYTMVPLMRNLHAFDWICPDGHRRYQGPSGPCKECGKETTRDVVWIAKESPKSVSYAFDATPHFQYFGDYAKRPEGQGDITETMSLQGSCFMLTRDKYWKLNVCDENFGSWGSQGIEVAVKTWLSGGHVLCNKKTWYAHMFRTQGGDFGFPYPISGSQQEKAKTFARDLFFNNKWDKQVRPLYWLVEKFWPVPGWTEDDLKKLKADKFKFSDGKLKAKPAESEPVEDKPNKGVVFYTDNQLKVKIAHTVQKNLRNICKAKGIPIVSVSLKPMTFGDKNVRLPLKRGYLTMFKQILAGLEALDTEFAFLIDHDVLYHPTHFDFTPPRNDVYYYNQNVWRIRTTDGFALHYHFYSGCCANRQFLINHYRTRIKKIEDLMAKGEPIHWRGMGFEAGTHARAERIDDYKADIWNSEFPNIDIRYGNNLTSSRWKKEEFRSQRNCQGWEESNVDKIHGWDNLRKTMESFK
jgi:glycosyltransferase involved in cell wall biosynthesis